MYLIIIGVINNADQKKRKRDEQTTPKAGSFRWIWDGKTGLEGFYAGYTLLLL